MPKFSTLVFVAGALALGFYLYSRRAAAPVKASTSTSPLGGTKGRGTIFDPEVWS